MASNCYDNLEEKKEKPDGSGRNGKKSGLDCR